MESNISQKSLSSKLLFFCQLNLQCHLKSPQGKLIRFFYELQLMLQTFKPALIKICVSCFVIKPKVDVRLTDHLKLLTIDSTISFPFHPSFLKLP